MNQREQWEPGLPPEEIRIDNIEELYDDESSTSEEDSSSSDSSSSSSSSYDSDSDSYITRQPLIFRALRGYAERYGILRDHSSSNDDTDDDSIPPLLERREETDWSSDESEGSLWCRPLYAPEPDSSALNQSEADARGAEIMQVALLFDQLCLPDISIQMILEYADAKVDEEVAASHWLYRGKDNDDTSYLAGNLSVRDRPMQQFFQLSGLSILVSSRGVGPPNEHGFRMNLCTKVDLELRGQSGREDKPRAKLFQHVNAGRKWERMECEFDENCPEVQWLKQELLRNGAAAVDLLAVSVPGWKCKIRSATIRASWKPRALSILCAEMQEPVA